MSGSPGPVKVDPVNKTCTPDNVSPGAAGTSAAIVFTIDAPAADGWKWVSLVINNATPTNPPVATPPASEIFTVNIPPNGVGNITVTDRNRRANPPTVPVGDAGSFKYTVTLKKGSGPLVPIDPTIENES